MDCVKEYKKRRDGRMKAKAGREDDQWITMKGTHVMIDDGGQVSKGPDKLKNVVSKTGGYKPKSGGKESAKPDETGNKEYGYGSGNSRPTMEEVQKAYSDVTKKKSAETRTKNEHLKASGAVKGFDYESISSAYGKQEADNRLKKLKDKADAAARKYYDARVAHETAKRKAEELTKLYRGPEDDPEDEDAPLF